MTRRSIVIAWRLTFGLLTLAAIGTQFTIQLQDGFSVVNFFSYFTNLPNLIATIVFLFGAFQLIAQREPSATTDLIRAGSVVNMAVVGVVFSALLREPDLGALLPWVNSLLHYIMPVAVLGQRIFLIVPSLAPCHPERQRRVPVEMLRCAQHDMTLGCLKVSASPSRVAHPATDDQAWYATTPAVPAAPTRLSGLFGDSRRNRGWYAYPFLNPATVGGYAGVAVYVISIVVTFSVVGWLLFTLGNRLNENSAVGLDIGQKSVPSVDKTP